LSHTNVKEILTSYNTVAIVGLSKDSLKASYQVAEYLKKHGFHIVPVNPNADEILGEKSYKSLLEIPVEIQKTLEIVDVFRSSADVPPIVERTVQLKRLYGVPYVVWMQLGIINDQAAELARKAGLAVVMDRCIMQEHKRLFGGDGE
jgi:hypothetical protein